MSQARTEFAAALNQIASEKGVDVSVVIDAIESAALAAYRKDLTLRSEVVPEDIEEFTSSVDPITGEISIFHGKENVTPPGFARIAAGIARQVIMQKLHEAEKGAILSEYDGKIGTLISGSIQRQEGNTYFIDLGRVEGVMPPSEQVRDEVYIPNQRMKFFIKGIRDEGRGPQVVLSRSDAGLVKGLFAIEVPEIQSGSVEVRVIAREPGSRTKIAASSSQDGVDPVGSLVGQKGVRVQQVMSELGDEKIDIIAFSEDPARFITAALSPAKEIKVELNEETKVATVTAPNDQLSLAIGKGGQNVRLAAKLTGWKIDIVGSGPSIEELMAEKEAASAESDKSEPSVIPSEVEESLDSEKSTDKESKEDIKEEIEKAEEKIEEAAKEETVEKEEEQLEEAIGEKEEGTHEEEKQVSEDGGQPAPSDDQPVVDPEGEPVDDTQKDDPFVEPDVETAEEPKVEESPEPEEDKAEG